MAESSGYKSSENRGSGGYCRDRNGGGPGQVDWKYVVSTSVMAGVISLLTSVAGIPEAGGSEGG